MVSTPFTSSKNMRKTAPVSRPSVSINMHLMVSIKGCGGPTETCRSFVVNIIAHGTEIEGNGKHVQGNKTNKKDRR